MKGPLTDKIRILHILDAITEVENYLSGVSIDAFMANSGKRFATIKQIEIVGEACNHLTPELKEAHPEIEWKAIKGFRNISIHEYFGVNLELVWVLKQQFSEIEKDL